MALREIFNVSSPNTLIHLIAAIIILIAGFILGSLLSKLTRKILNELETNKILKEQAGIRLPIEEFISRSIKYIVYLIAIIWALNQLGLTTRILEIILVTILVILVIFIILAVKDFIPNVVAGFLIYQKGIIKKGDVIRIKTTEGKVIHIDLLETRIITKNKEVVHIPNAYITKHELMKIS